MNAEQGPAAVYAGDWTAKLGERVDMGDEVVYEVTSAEYQVQSNTTLVAFTPVAKSVLCYGNHSINGHESGYRFAPLCGQHHKHDGTQDMI